MVLIYLQENSHDALIINVFPLLGGCSIESVRPRAFGSRSTFTRPGEDLPLSPSIPGSSSPVQHDPQCSHPRPSSSSSVSPSRVLTHAIILQRIVVFLICCSSFSLSLSRQVPNMLLAGAPQEEYLRDGFRPYASAEELRMPLLPLGLSSGTAADSLAYFHSGYLPHPSLASYRYVV